MSIKLKLSIIAFILALFIIVIVLLRNGKLSTKYAILWLFTCFVLALFIIFPGILVFISKLLGFEAQTNMIFSIFIGIIIFLLLSFTIIVSNQKKKINMLIQEVSILKEKINNK